MTGPNIGLVLDAELRRLLPGARDLLNHWQENCGASGLPDRSAFDPLSLRPYLGNLVITDVETPDDPALPRRFRYRLVGTILTERSGRDVTGRYFEDLYDPTSLAEMRHCFGWVIDNRLPARVFGTFRHANRAYLGFDGLFMPITVGTSTTANQVIGYVVPNDG